MKLYQKLIVLLFFFQSSLLFVYSQSVNKDRSDEEKKLFSFGLIADVQYADAEKAGNRDYRNSLNKLGNCIEEFNRHNLSFVVNLGDLIDHDYASFDKPLEIIKGLKVPVYHVRGNHDFSVEEEFKGNVRKRLNNKNGYFSFEADHFSFIVLDGTDVSIFASTEGSRQHKTAMDKYKELQTRGANNAYNWNGGIGKRQLKWLEERLQKADAERRKVILFCHWPLLPENGTQLWNNKEVLSMINHYHCVVAWIAGHHHAGSYEKMGDIHYLTLKGMVEAKSGMSCGIINVYSDKLLLDGYGDQKDQRLDFTED